MRRAYDLLRSRRLAFWLIAAFIGYAAIATVVTEADYGRAYDNPVFFAITLLLTLATAACAWERTERAARMWKVGSGATAEFVSRLESAPQIAVPVPDDVDVDEVLSDVAAGLRSARLRVRSGGGRVVASSPRLALVGSPLFHWSLVALFLFVGAGRLTRSEGMIGIPVGSSRPDIATSYGVLTEGPLHGNDFTGLTIKVPDLTLDYVADGVDRGAAPLVELWDSDTLVASRLVYPNSPLRYGSVMIHPNTYGLAARFSLEGGSEPLPAEVLYDFLEEAPVAENTAPLEVWLDDESVRVTSGIALDTVGAVAPWVLPADPRVKWTTSGPAGESDGVIAIGEAIDLGGGARLVLEDVTYYARVSVVDDWSVYPIYLTFVVGMIGLALALLLPPKTAWVMLVHDGGSSALHARTRQGRGDRVFPHTVNSVLVTAAQRKDEPS